MDARSSRPEAESRYIHAASASPTPIPQRLPRMVSRASTEARNASASPSIGRTSRWTRFFTDLSSGTSWNSTRGRPLA